MTKDWVEDHMFDDSFQMTARYFSVLQLLRIFPTWIENSSKDVETLCDCRGSAEATKNMETLRGNKNRLVDELKKRIAQKVEEVESLRDGVSDPGLQSNLQYPGPPFLAREPRD